MKTGISQKMKNQTSPYKGFNIHGNAGSKLLAIIFFYFYFSIKVLYFIAFYEKSCKAASWINLRAMLIFDFLSTKTYMSEVNNQAHF